MGPNPSWMGFPKTNDVQQGWRDSSTIWLDHNANPQERFKMGLSASGRLSLRISPNGIHTGALVLSGFFGGAIPFTRE